MPNAFARAAAALNGMRADWGGSWSNGTGGSWGNGGSTFSGASLQRMYEDWSPWTYSPNLEVYWASRFMRARARQLVRDNPYVAGIIGAIQENVVGDAGRTLRAKIKNSSGKLATTTNKEIERGWKDWGLPEHCGSDGRTSWIDAQNLHVGTMAMDGEVIVRKLPGFDNAHGFALQFIDADLLDETYSVPAGGPNQNEIRMGIELDEYNRPLFYHIWNHYPFEKTGMPLVREKVPAAEIYHDFIPYRANQVRGVTWFAPVLLMLHTLASYDEAELVASWVAAAQMGFIINKSQEAIAAWDWKPEEMGKRRMGVEPGQIPELLPGQELAAFNPGRPNTTHDAFVTTELRGVARGLKVSHFTMTGDTRQANYSSMRVSLQPERDHWRVIQAREAMHFDRRVYRDWMPMALLNQQLRLDTRLAADYSEVLFEGRGWKWVAPKEDIETAEREIRLGLTSRQRLCAERGLDFEGIAEELAHEKEVADQFGIDISGVDIIRTDAPTLDEGGGAGSVETPDDGTSDNSNGKTPPNGNGKNGHLAGRTPLKLIEAVFKRHEIGVDRP